MDNLSLNSSNLTLDPLRKDPCLTSMKTLIKIIQTCVGPRASLKLLQHQEGGAGILTSSSQRLLPILSVKDRISAIIISTAKTQLKKCNDNGLCCMFLILKSIHHAVLTECRLPLIGALYTHLSNIYIECLNTSNNLSVMSIDFSDLKHLKSIVLSMLNSKRGYALTSVNKDYIASLILKAFLGTIPSNKLLRNINTRVISMEGRDVNHSRLFKGVLVPVSKEDANRFQKEMGPFRIALFTTSLAGETDCPVKNIVIDSSFSVAKASLIQLEKTIEKVIAENVDFVFCQKVIHPYLKKKLQYAGISFLDRLGTETTKYVQFISGGNAITSLIVSEFSYGTLSRSEIVLIEERTFLLFSSDDTPFFSLALCNYNAQSLSELQVVCQQIFSALYRVLCKGKVCYGAGCTEVCTVQLWATKLKENSSSIQSEFNCTLGQLEFVKSAFLKSIIDFCVALHQGTHLDFVTEAVYGHLWEIKDGQFPNEMEHCACGRYSALGIDSWMFLSDIGKSDLYLQTSPKESFQSPFDLLVLDELSCKESAFSLAFEVASLLLRTTVVVNKR
ncbi:hypothetical protein TNIN_377541 [Trichonephila inaurata madagascariensis]|uniref:Uncharacterized protein n=1 Tax=Trichonephila inaurata madagascariensis TaxID=2747483 RepID=A0A8X6YE92_9ARAC|nr:hypothetical protein TNIN_377541 [Trichonephila inaurata madagascariensis]